MLSLLFELLFFCFLPFVVMFIIVVFVLDKYPKEAKISLLAIVFLDLFIFIGVNVFFNKNSDKNSIKTLVSFGSPSFIFYNNHEYQNVTVKNNTKDILKELHANNYDVIICDFISGMKELKKDLSSPYKFCGSLTSVGNNYLVSLKEKFNKTKFSSKTKILAFDGKENSHMKIFYKLKEKSKFLKGLDEKNIYYKSIPEVVNIFKNNLSAIRKGKKIEKKYDYDYYIIPEPFFSLAKKNSDIGIKSEICFCSLSSLCYAITEDSFFEEDDDENFLSVLSEAYNELKILAPQTAIFINENKLKKFLKSPKYRKILDNYFLGIALKEREFHFIRQMIGDSSDYPIFNESIKNIDKELLKRTLGVEIEDLKSLNFNNLHIFVYFYSNNNFDFLEKFLTVIGEERLKDILLKKSTDEIGKLLLANNFKK